MGAQSYPGAVWAPVTRFPPNWQFTSQTLDCLLSHGFFFSQSRPGAPRATSDPRFGFSTVDPPTSQRENLEKKKVESRVQKSEIPKGADFFQEPDTENRDSASGLCHVCLFGRRADEKKRPFGDCLTWR